jgi:hypothetical protein
MAIKTYLLPDGKYRDQLQRANGTAYDFGWRSNVVVNQCRQLLAAFMRGEAATGIQFIALGRGNENWDDQAAPESDPNTDSLTDASPVIISIADAAMQVDFINSLGAVIADVSQRIQVSVNLEPGSLPIIDDEVFPLREFALFGRLGAEDYMIDYVRHPVMHIGAGDTLTRRIRLVF